MESFREEFAPIKDCSIVDIQVAIEKVISDLTKSVYSCKIDNIEFMDWDKASIKLTLDGSGEAIKNIASRSDRKE